MEKFLDREGLSRVWDAIKNKFVPKNRKINNKSLDADIELTAADIGAEAATKEIAATLTANEWVGNSQTIVIDESTANAKVGLAMTATNEQLEAVMLARLLATSQTEHTITITAFGTIPTVDIPIIIHTN